MSFIIMRFDMECHIKKCDIFHQLPNDFSKYKYISSQYYWFDHKNDIVYIDNRNMVHTKNIRSFLT
jgi:hypothetical protein